MSAQKIKSIVDTALSEPFVLPRALEQQIIDDIFKTKLVDVERGNIYAILKCSLLEM